MTADPAITDDTPLRLAVAAETAFPGGGMTASGPRMTSEIRSHTALRGVAALLVVTFHYRATLQSGFDIDSYTQFFARGYLWVDLFFTLSGYILCHVYALRPGESLRSSGTFFAARFARIYPLHAATLLFLVVWQVTVPLATRHSAHVGEWSTLWLNILDIHAWGFLQRYDWNFPSWSISVEFAAYLLFPIICIGIRRIRTITLFVLAAMLGARIFFSTAIDTRDGWEQLAILRCLPMFFLGVMLYRSRQSALQLSDGLLTAVQLASAVLIVRGLHSGWRDSLMIGPFALLVYSSQTDRGLISGWLCTKLPVLLGEWSYSIYMLHIPVQIVFLFFWPKIISEPLGLTVGQASISVALTSVIATIVVAGVSYRYFEMPSRARLRHMRSFTPQTVVGTTTT